MAARHAAMLVVISAMTGASFLFIEIGLRDLPPEWVVLGRSGGAFALTLPFGWAARHELRLTALLALILDPTQRASGVRLVGLAIGIVGVAVLLVAYLMPVTALVYGALLLDEPVTASAVVGLALILGGVGLGTGLVRR